MHRSIPCGKFVGPSIPERRALGTLDLREVLWKWYSSIQTTILGPFQTSNFTCAESSANERKQ